MARFEELEVWKRSARMSAELYKMAELRDYGFKYQITRAGLSIPSNIAEGYECASNKENANFLNYAKGSAGELRTQLYIAYRNKLHRAGNSRKWIQEAEEISKMLHSLINSISDPARLYFELIYQFGSGSESR